MRMSKLCHDRNNYHLVQLSNWEIDESNWEIDELCLIFVSGACDSIQRLCGGLTKGRVVR